MFKFLKKKDNSDEILKSIHELMDSNRQVIGYIARLVEKEQEPITVSVRDLPYPKVEIPEIVIPEPKVIVDSNVPQELSGSIDKLIDVLSGFAIRNKEQITYFLEEINKRDHVVSNKNTKLLQSLNRAFDELKTTISNLDKFQNPIDIKLKSQDKHDKKLIENILSYLHKNPKSFSIFLGSDAQYPYSIDFQGKFVIDYRTGQIIKPFEAMMTTEERAEVLDIITPMIENKKEHFISRIE